MKEIKLKECPCCGGETKFRTIDGVNGKPISVYVHCTKCGLETKAFKVSVDYCAKEEAAKVWNRREGKQLKCPTCEEEGLCITQFNYIFNKMSAKIHCDICGTDIEIPDIKKCTGALSELIFNEK
nr:MAG TPA: restriction alleviation protein [Caudoviricetes sp.]